MHKILLLLLPWLSFANLSPAADRPNVLFIAVDDLRPQLNCYGRPQMISPNIDALAQRGVLFERAYCMVPTCGASRAALMTSIRPARDRFVTHLTWAEKDAADALPLHKQFKNAGYTTLSLGKIFHHPADHADGWSQPPWRSDRPSYHTPQAKLDLEENKRRWPEKKKHNSAPFEASDDPDSEYQDGDCANRAIKQLVQLSQHPEQPFFLAVGFIKPHLPFNAPRKYWDLYDAKQIQLPENYSYAPKDAPDGAVHNSGELRAYAKIHPTAPVAEDTARQMIHGYYACVSFTDAQIGRVIGALDQLGLGDNTIIVLWGDHGWQLGEHGMWNKHSCFETSMHAPLIIAAPNRPDIQAGSRVRGLTEFIDVYPSLCELAGLDIPPHVQGRSFVPQMADPSLPGKAYAIGRFGAGDTIRVDDARYSEYTTPKGELTGKMLYDHGSDPRENTNIASGQGQSVEQLSKQLNALKGR